MIFRFSAPFIPPGFLRDIFSCSGTSKCIFWQSRVTNIHLLPLDTPQGGTSQRYQIQQITNITFIDFYLLNVGMSAIEIQGYSKLILKRLMKVRYFKFLSEFFKGSIIRGQFLDSRAKTRRIALMKMSNQNLFRKTLFYIKPVSVCSKTLSILLCIKQKV